MSFTKYNSFILSLFLAACSTTNAPTKHQPPLHSEESTKFIYTTPNGKTIDLQSITFKTNGMVRTGTVDVLGLGGTLYTYTRYGAWCSQTGASDVFIIGHQPSGNVNLAGDQIYYGRALRSNRQTLSVYDNRLTFALNFTNKSFTAFSVSIPDIRTFGKAIAMQGKIENDTFSGNVESGKDSGTFSGRFYGPNGTEFVGIARFSNSDLDFSFGGVRQ